MKSTDLEQIVELLCQKGCQAVWADIEALDRGEELPETRGLNELEKGQVLKEIKSIMAVYKGRCDIGA